ncbi:MAG: D-alanine--D-alanine ligase [Chloroflexi bacterium]|nr:D-alanine--D-alanine ligase [Chloroflexota bacterium]
MSKKIRVGVIFGGKSGEHEVSLMSARSVMKAIDKDKYEVVTIGIDKQGRWLTSGDPMRLLSQGTTASDQPQLTPHATQHATRNTHLVPLTTAERELIPGTQKTAFPQVDVIFPILHGPYGEDGTVQGLLELADIPYVGAGVTGSALGMDKAIFKDVMRAHGLPTADDVLVKRKEWEANPEAVLDRIEAALDYPVFTKPTNLGSSVGISKCHDRAGLAAGLAAAAGYDRKILVEAAVPAAREIEVSVLGNDDPIASVPGEIIPSREFYSYEAKYIDSGDEASELLIPAPIPPETAERARDLAVRAYLAIDCAGMARADFLLSDETGELYVNELNTIPGFTAISMYPKLWEASGIAYPELIDRLIELALERHEDKKRSRTSYSPPEKNEG